MDVTLSLHIQRRCLSQPIICCLLFFVLFQAGSFAAASTTPVPARKEPLTGLIDRQHTQWADQDGGAPDFTLDNVSKFPGLFGGIVLNTTWNAIQPTRNGDPDFSTIDNALDQVRTYNSNHPDQSLGVKLRVWAGANAPMWAKQRDGGPVDIVRNPAGCHPSPCPLTIGKFWSPVYIRAWRKFQELLAAKYDGEPLIHQVAVTSCTQQTDEPFVPTVDAQAKANLVAAGYTDDAQQKCLMGAITDYAAWKQTLIDFSFNTFNKIGGGVDPAFTISVMEACRKAYDNGCVLDNQALNDPLYPADQAIYKEMQTLGQPIQLQTAGPEAMNCQWKAVIAQGVKLNAAAIEVWPESQYQGFDGFTPGQVTQLAMEFGKPISVPRVQPASGSCSGFH